MHAIRASRSGGVHCTDHSGRSGVKMVTQAVRSAIFILFLAVLLPQAVAQNFSGYVDPFIGTSGHGHTFPGATLPFGLVQLSPDTRYSGWDACGGYHYSDSVILGFSHLHLSGTGIADYGDILFTPTMRSLDFTPDEEGRPSYRHSSSFSHRNEIASPGYYAVFLDDDSIQVELTATPRCGMHRYTFPHGDSAAIIIDLLHGLGPDRVLESSVEIAGDSEISGYRRSAGWAADQRIYFSAIFSKPFWGFGVVRNDTIIPESRADSGKNLRAFVTYRTGKVEEVMVKVGISTVSVAGARKNLAAEMPGWDFDKVRATGELVWNRELSRIVTEGGTERQNRIFYTALYHAMIAPNIAADVDGSYRGMDGEVRTERDFTMHSVFSLWDTFRAEHPLLTLIDPARTSDFVRSLLRKFEEGGTLPVWELASNETWTMIGYHAVPVIVDAFVKGVTNFDTVQALRAMKHSAEMDHQGLAYYRQYGYIPGDLEGESVSRTLEYAYDDWCISEFAARTGDPRARDEFGERALYYRNLFDPATGFMRPRINGGWAEPFDPRAVTFHYTEANPWQYSFFVPHDISGLMELYGGKERFASKLDSLFFSGSVLTGRKQSDITGLIGQYAQGNEPSHNFAYLYPYAGQAWKTQKLVRTIMDSLYTDLPDGLCGNDDCGQMSAWYVFGALGFYPVTPGTPFYTIGTPFFPRVRLNLPNRKMFVIEAPNVSDQRRFIRRVSLNSSPLTSLVIRHDALLAGGELRFEMGAAPDTNIPDGTAPFPGVSSAEKITTVPFFTTSKKTFRDSLVIGIASSTPGSTIYFTTDGTVPTFASAKYTSPLVLKKTTVLQAIASAPGMKSSHLNYGEFIKRSTTGAIELMNAYSPQYTGGGDDALIDGVVGTTDFRLGAWQGYEEKDLDAIIDLGGTRRIRTVTLDCLQDNNSWIFFPTSVEVSLSTDGTTFSNPVVIVNDVPAEQTGAMKKEFSAGFAADEARYVRVRGRNIGRCPPWHKGAGGKAWLFADEITVTSE